VSEAGKKVLFALASIMLAVGLALGLAEAALEILDYPPNAFSPWIRMQATGYGYAASFHTRMKRPGEYDVAFDTNSAGFRDDEIGPKSGTRIVLLGDSFASGYGVERGQMFADILEDKLGVEIVNTAVGGYEIIHQVRFFQSRGHALEPDLVVYALYLGNDLSRNKEWGSDGDGTLTSPSHEFPVRTPHPIKLQMLYKQVRYAAGMRDEQARGEWEPWPDYLLSAERTPGAEATEDYRDVETLLRRLNDEVRSSGARLFVVMIPYRQMVDQQAYDRLRAQTPNFDARYDLGLPARRTTEILDRLGIDHFDLTPAFRSHFEQGGGPLFFPVDGHLNVEGNSLVAQILEPALRTQLGVVERLRALAVCP
jgi:lysophospholipase L1-like esterase